MTMVARGTGGALVMTTTSTSVDCFGENPHILTQLCRFVLFFYVTVLRSCPVGALKCYDDKTLTGAVVPNCFQCASDVHPQEKAVVWTPSVSC